MATLTTATGNELKAFLLKTYGQNHNIVSVSKKPVPLLERTIHKGATDVLVCKGKQKTICNVYLNKHGQEVKTVF